MKKILIVNGSPRKNGDTVFLLNELKRYLQGEIIEISAYYSNIKPCVDCRQCVKTGKCVVNDDMQRIYENDYDAVVMAYPVYYGTAPGPVWSLLSRFQCYHSLLEHAKHPPVKEKKAGLILTAGGKGNELKAARAGFVMFKMTNAHGYEDYLVTSPNTDSIPPVEDVKAQEGIKKLAEWLEKESRT